MLDSLSERPQTDVKAEPREQAPSTFALASTGSHSPRIRTFCRFYPAFFIAAQAPSLLSRQARSTMRILLIGNYLPDQQESMQRFAQVLQIELSSRGHEVRLACPKPYLGSWQLPSNAFRKWLGYIDKLAIFPWTLDQLKRWADLVHICDHSNAVYTRYLQDKPHLVTCNDLIAIRSALGEFPAYPTRWTGKQYQSMILAGLTQSQQIACISQKTQTDLHRITQLPAERSLVIYMGLNYAYTPMSAEQFDPILKKLGVSQNQGYILHVGGNQWYKNRLGVIDIFYYLRRYPDFARIRLVMVGKPLAPEMVERIRSLQLEDQVQVLLSIDNESLRALYSGATALLFPSLAEGFGWPVIEAQACGCPVFTSDLPPLSEIGGSESAVYLDPSQPQQAAQHMAEHLPMGESRRQAGLANAQRFSTDQMIDSYLRVYHQLCPHEDPA